ELEKRHGGRLERVYPQLVHHFSQGDVPDRTVEYGLRMARAALDAFSGEEAGRAARTVLEFLDEEWEGDPALEGEARFLLAQSYRMAGDVEAALRESESAGKILQRENRYDSAVAAFLFAAETAWQSRKIEETARLVPLVIEVARTAQESISLKNAFSLAATLATMNGKYEKTTGYSAQFTQLAP